MKLVISKYFFDYLGDDFWIGKILIIGSTTGATCVLSKLSHNGCLGRGRKFTTSLKCSCCCDA